MRTQLADARKKRRVVCPICQKPVQGSTGVFVDPKKNDRRFVHKRTCLVAARDARPLLDL